MCQEGMDNGPSVRYKEDTRCAGRQVGYQKGKGGGTPGKVIKEKKNGASIPPELRLQPQKPLHCNSAPGVPAAAAQAGFLMVWAASHRHRATF